MWGTSLLSRMSALWVSRLWKLDVYGTGAAVAMTVTGPHVSVRVEKVW